MKKIIIPFILIALTACEQTAVNSENPSNLCEVTFQINDNLTRSGKTVFEIGDSIGIFALKSVGDPQYPTASVLQATNTKWKKTERGWAPASPRDKVVWTQDGQPMYFYAYAPYRRDVITPGTDDLRFNLPLPTAQTTLKKVEEADVLRAVNLKGLTGGSVDLFFEHQYCHITVRLKDVPEGTVSVNMVNVPINIAMNPANGAQTVTRIGSIKMKQTDTDSQLYTAVIPKMVAKGGEVLFQCTINEENVFNYKPAQDIILQAGGQQTFEITMKKRN